MAYRVGIAGATGLVGQRLVARLAGHPWFHLQAVGASGRSAGRRYREAATWLLPEPMPADAGDLLVGPCTPEGFAGCDVVLSALDSATGREVEPALEAAGIAVVSNSSAMRMQPGVPLLVPEINASHVEVLNRRAGPRRGFVVTNPNCSVTGLAMALAPLHRAFGVRRVIVATMQAVSGAGLTGPRSIELLDNVIPYIEGEEEKIEVELAKILGGADERGFVPAEIGVAAHCHRVNTLDGHLEAVSVELRDRPTVEEAIAALETFEGDVASSGLPSAPKAPIVVRREPDRPQTRLDRDTGNGMSVVVGRVRPCPVLTLRLVVLSHNTVRGAAGGAILNAELLAARGLLPRGSSA
jgi:aspartate-semialdehyde dehydrogenase